MIKQRVGTLKLDRTPINSHIPCESCGYRRSKVKLSVPGGPTHRLCDRCDPKQ